MLTATLESQHLLMSDFGALTGSKATSAASLDKGGAGKAAAAPPAKAAPVAPASQYLFPDARLQTDRVRAMDADVRFTATSIDAGKVPFKAVNLHAKLKMACWGSSRSSSSMPEGRLSGTIHIDARDRIPQVRMDVRALGISLQQLKGSKPGATAPVDGVLQGAGGHRGQG